MLFTTFTIISGYRSLPTVLILRICTNYRYLKKKAFIIKFYIYSKSLQQSTWWRKTERSKFFLQGNIPRWQERTRSQSSPADFSNIRCRMYVIFLIFSISGKNIHSCFALLVSKELSFQWSAKDYILWYNIAKERKWIRKYREIKRSLKRTDLMYVGLLIANTLSIYSLKEYAKIAISVASVNLLTLLIKIKLRLFIKILQ